MKPRAILLLSIAFVATALAAEAETWRTIDRRSFEGNLGGVYGPLVAIVSKTGTELAPIDKLDDTALGRVADYLAAPKPPSSWGKPESAMGKALRGKLQVMREGKLVAFDPGARSEPELYLVYFGAHWCPPCRAFSPTLVARYAKLKEIAGDAFEVIFVSSDHDSSEQKDYVKGVGMTWPVLRYSARGDVPAVEHWEGPGIPCLVALTRDGDVLLHSYHGAEYIGAEPVLDQFEALLRTWTGQSEEVKRAKHRLAVIEHVRAAGGASMPAKPYLISFDRRRYQTLEQKKLTATLEIDEFGHVQSAHIEPELPAVLDYQLVTDTESWLFLPAVENGKAKAIRAVLPILL